MFSPEQEMEVNLATSMEARLKTGHRSFLSNSKGTTLEETNLL